MSRLYGSIDADASKTEATRRAHRNISAHIRGWNRGVEVRGYVDENGRDVFEVYVTGGSNGGSNPQLVASIADDLPLASIATAPRNEHGEHPETLF